MDDEPDGIRRLNVSQTVAVLVLLVVRGFALWVIVPTTFIIWVLLLPVRILRRGKALKLRQYLHWADSAFSAVILKNLLRPLWREKVSFPAWPKPGEDAPLSFLRDAI